MSYQVHKYDHRKHDKTTEQKIIEGFLKGLWWIISLPFRLIFGGKKSFRQSPAGTSLDREFVNKKYSEIDSLMSLGGQSNFSRAVLDGDKLLDHVLKAYRAPGLTMGDRLKSSEKRFSHEAYNAAWKAHKVRNEIVHNAEYQIMDYMAKQAIDDFKQAINELINK